jgi:SAM-dependent methyltransferase
MGVSATVLDFLLAESGRRPFQGRLLTLGRQAIHVSYADIRRAAQAAGTRLGALGGDHGDAEAFAEDHKAPTDTSFFRMLGFSEHRSLDSSPYEGADIVFDLNAIELPDELRGRFDVVLDIAVMEHVFNIAQAMRNIHEMLAVGGRFVFFVPAIHTIDAAFFGISPTFFYDFFRANDYLVNALKLYRFPLGHYHNARPDRILDYEPGVVDGRLGLDGCYWDVFCVATKGPRATGHKIPRQHYYEQVWEIARLNDRLALDIEQVFRHNARLRRLLAASLTQEERAELARSLPIEQRLTGDERRALVQAAPVQERFGNEQELHGFILATSPAARSHILDAFSGRELILAVWKRVRRRGPDT